MISKKQSSRVPTLTMYKDDIYIVQLHCYFQANMPSLNFYSNINSPLYFDTGQSQQNKSLLTLRSENSFIGIERLSTVWSVDGGLQKKRWAKSLVTLFVLCKPRTYILEEVEEGPTVAVMPSLAAPSACGHCEVN